MQFWQAFQRIRAMVQRLKKKSRNQLQTNQKLNDHDSCTL
jgi:hypothetical protein